MYAIIETGGKQYYVSEGDVIYVEKLDAEEGKEDYSEYVFDAVDRAAKEIVDGKVYIKINGQYSVTPESELEKEIREVQEANKE